MLFRELSNRGQRLVVDALLGDDVEDVTDEDREEIIMYITDERNFVAIDEEIAEVRE